MKIELDEVGLNIFGHVKDAAGKEWESWTPNEKEIVLLASKAAAELQFDLLRGADENDIRGRKERVEAILKQVTVAGQISAARIVWSGVQKALEIAVGILVKVVLK